MTCDSLLALFLDAENLTMRVAVLFREKEMFVLPWLTEYSVIGVSSPVQASGAKGDPVA